jgi:hypothetical protein
MKISILYRTHTYQCHVFRCSRSILPQFEREIKSFSLQSLLQRLCTPPVAKADLAREAAVMEALAEVEEDAWLDDGAMEGSGDEYRP